MKVGKTALVEVFEAIGVPTAKSWTVDKLSKRVNAAGKLESMKGDEVELEGDVATLYDDLVSAVGKGKAVEVVDDTPAAGSNGKATKAGKTKKEKAPAAERGPGVIASILKFLQSGTAKKPVTKEDVHQKLIKLFPDRDADSMWSTINIQIPNRLRVDRGVHVNRNENGYWVEGDGSKPGSSPAGRAKAGKAKAGRTKKKAKDVV
jgi:hypothetical protein